MVVARNGIVAGATALAMLVGQPVMAQNSTMDNTTMLSCDVMIGVMIESLVGDLDLDMEDLPIESIKIETCSEESFSADLGSVKYELTGEDINLMQVGEECEPLESNTNSSSPVEQNATEVEEARLLQEEFVQMYQMDANSTEACYRMYCKEGVTYVAHYEKCCSDVSPSDEPMHVCDVATELSAEGVTSAPRSSGAMVAASALATVAALVNLF
mmetsp:Transcript_15913/g.29119  ORF Transcript_15913/g.29119 Transcript_15913/m.29119 type:complete len:214 (+) Transcript_15913:230-871(+)